MVPRDPSSCRGWIAFRVGPHFSRPSARRGLLRHGAGWAQRSLPVPCMLQRCPILGGSEDCFQATAGCCPPPRCDRARGRMGARVMASGMPEVSRRAVLGGATYAVVKVRVRLRGAVRPGSVTISATSLTRVQRGGVNPGHCARGFGAMSHWPVVDWPVGRRLKLALRGQYSTEVLGRVKEGLVEQEDLRQSSGELKTLRRTENAIRSTTMKRPCEGHEGARGGLSGLKLPLQFVRATAECRRR